MTRWTIAGAALTALVASGCVDADSGPVAPASLARAAAPDIREILGVRQLWPQEAQFQSLSDSVPGYAGHYVDASGDLIVLVVDVQAAAQRGAVIQRVAARTRAVQPRATGEVRIRKVEYSFSELRRWRDGLFGEAFSHTDVLTLDLDERRNRVVVGTRKGTSDLLAPVLRASAEDMPSGALIVEEYETVEDGPVAPAAGSSGTLQGYQRPMQAGLQVVSGVGACTAGLISRWQFTTPVMVTATHCSESWGDLDGGSFYQNLSSFIGQEIVDQTSWECNPGKTCVYADANVVSITDHSPSVHEIARPEPFGGITIDATSPTYFVVGEHPYSYMGMDIFLVGRTSGLTAGEVDGTCVHYQDPDDSSRILVCQDTGTYESARGDSGAPVFSIQGGTSVLMAGIHWARVGFVFPGGYIRRSFSPMSQVRIDLDMLEPLFHW